MLHLDERPFRMLEQNENIALPKGRPLIQDHRDEHR